MSILSNIKFNTASLKTGLMLAVGLTALATAGGALATAFNDPGSRSAGTAGSGGLVASKEEVDAGAVTVGATAQVVVKFRNDSGKDVKIGAVNFYPSSTVSASEGLNECSKVPLPAGAECAVVVSVKGLKTGAFRIDLLVRHDGKARIVTASLTGNVEAGESDADALASDIELIPNEKVDFETLNSSTPMVRSVILRNITSEPIEIKGMNIQAAEQSGYSLTSDCSKLDAGQACVATITWAPVTKGQSDGILVVEHTGSTRVASVNLTGKFQPDAVKKAEIFPDAVPGLGLLISSQETLDFGTVDDKATITASLVNVGDTDLTLDSVMTGGVENGLNISKSGCKVGTVLAPVEACPLTVSWSPVRKGAILDDIQVRHNGARGVLVIPVKGTANQAVNKDTQAVVETADGEVVTPQINKTQALEGFVVTSHSGTKAIINGPGGSRVVSEGQQIVLGGVSWTASITSNGVQFKSGKDKVSLLFDRSLSSVNRGGSSSSSTNTSTTTTSATSTTTP